MRRRLLRLSGVSVEVETFSSDRSRLPQLETRQAHEPPRATGEGGSLLLVYIQTDYSAFKHHSHNATSDFNVTRLT